MAGATTITIGDVTAKIMADGYRKGAGWGTGPWRVIRYLVAWDESDDFIDGLLGTTNTVVYRGAPFPVPHSYPGNPALRCVNAEVVETFGPERPVQGAIDPLDDTLWACDWAAIDALYRTLDYPVSPFEAPSGAGQFDSVTSPFARASIRYGMRTYTIPAVAATFEDNTPWTGTSPINRVMNTIDYVFRYEMFPGVPHSLWRSMMNRVNDSEFWGCPRGTLLFRPGSCDPVKSPTGAFLSSAEFTLSYQPEDHNAVPGEETGEWVIVKKADGTYAYPYTDFSVLSGI